MDELVYSISVNNKPFPLGLCPINRFDLDAMTELAKSLYNNDATIQSVGVEAFYTYMPDVPGKTVFLLERNKQ